jgi:hypothetical protein
MFDEGIHEEILKKCCNQKLVRGKDHEARLVEMEPVKIYAVKKCKHCLTIWNRDINAARNILYIFMSLVISDVIPFFFRQGTDHEVSTVEKRKKKKKSVTPSSQQ